MVDSRSKGLRGEYAVRDLLRKHTGMEEWERVPSSGALAHTKGDIYLPGTKQKVIIEVKNYADNALTDKILTTTTNNILRWWSKLDHQAKMAESKPLLFYKYNRSKWFMATDMEPTTLNKFLYIGHLGCYTMLAEEWLTNEWENYVKEVGIKRP